MPEREQLTPWKSRAKRKSQFGLSDGRKAIGENFLAHHRSWGVHEFPNYGKKCSDWLRQKAIRKMGGDIND